MKAFVMIVSSDQGLFFRVCRTDAQGVMWDVLSDVEYPWHLGFQDMQNALAIANNYNVDYETGISLRELAQKLATAERDR